MERLQSGAKVRDLAHHGLTPPRATRSELFDVAGSDSLGRLFPWAPTDVDPWAALRWVAGRLDLPSYGRTPPTWAWYASPLTEWDGTVKTDG
jgi:hypothetical protein